MPKFKNTEGMKGVGNKRGGGRVEKAGSYSSTRPGYVKANGGETSRPIVAGGAKHRGDRRDTSRLYTNNTKHSARADNPRPDVKTRKR